MTKVLVHKVTLLVIDREGIGGHPDGAQDLQYLLQELYCYRSESSHPKVMQVETLGVDWHDGHPLDSDYADVVRAEYDRLFPDKAGKL